MVNTTSLLEQPSFDPDLRQHRDHNGIRLE